MTNTPFQRRVLVALIGAGVVSLLAGFVGVILWGKRPPPSETPSDSFGYSALGHRGLYQLLDQAGYRVTRSMRVGRQVAENALLLMLEPQCEPEELEEALAVPSAVLVVLPKWTGSVAPRSEEADKAEKDATEAGARPLRKGWVHSVSLFRVDDVEKIVAGSGVDGALARVESGRPLDSVFREPPRVVAPLQLIRSGDLDPEVSFESGVLFGEFEESKFVLSDPDLITNHGLAANADLVLAMIHRITGGDRETHIVIDETLHGMRAPTNVWAALGQFPLVTVMISAVVMFGFWMWSGLRRFGAPVREAAAVSHGKRALIENTAQLLMAGGYSGSVLRRYFDRTQETVARHYRLSAELQGAAKLERLCEIPGSSEDLREIANDVEDLDNQAKGQESRLLSLARRIRQWKQETMHGTQ